MLLADVKEEPSEVLHATDLLSCGQDETYGDPGDHSGEQEEVPKPCAPIRMSSQPNCSRAANPVKHLKFSPRLPGALRTLRFLPSSVPPASSPPFRLPVRILYAPISMPSLRQNLPVLSPTDTDKDSKPRSVCARFPGSRQMNTHGKHDILRYMIPGEDKCYIFLFKRANQGYHVYTCRGCNRLKTPVTVKVIGDDFLSDPCQEPHRCVPVDALNEKVERLAYMRMCNLNRRLKRILVTKSSLAVPKRLVQNNGFYAIL
ncbi:hypothetical protein Q1695_011243 [Nippostrongylus brasiliensis]|nr:hypothetical protein Q1695_011243 [Nippostrongylus brasiliensis]